MVFTHANFNGLNVLTDADGHITGVGEIELETFRIWFVWIAVETFLGSTGSEGYSRVEKYDRLRAQFFELCGAIFLLKSVQGEDAIRLAEVVGILYGILLKVD